MGDAVLKDEQLEAMQAAIDEEFERSARLRKVLPEVPVSGTPYGVVIPRVATVNHQFGFTTDELKQPITLTAEIRIRSHQVDDQQNVLALIKSTTRRLASAEDRIIAFGGAVYDAENRPGDIGVRGWDEKTSGLFFVDGKYHKIIDKTDQVYEPLSSAMGDLESDATTSNNGNSAWCGKYPAPHVAVMASSAWRTFRELSYEQRKRTEAMFEEKLVVPAGGRDVEKSFVASEGKEPERCRAFAVVFSQEQMTCDLVRLAMPNGTSRGFHDGGDLRYIIESQFLLRVKDPSSLVRIWTKT